MGMMSKLHIKILEKRVEDLEADNEKLKKRIQELEDALKMNIRCCRHYDKPDIGRASPESR